MIISSLSKDDISQNFEAKVRRLTDVSSLREIRSCCPNGSNSDETFILFNNLTVCIIVLILIIIFTLLLLGLIKGLMGLYCCPPVGMCGLGALIDLPRPLKEYQEEELRDFPVNYDVIGWPIHPQTNKRTVRAISLKSEFCLNVIFFLTYPLLMIVTVLTSCCFRRIYDNEDVVETEYLKEHTIMITECPSIICKLGTSDQDAKCMIQSRTYNDESGGEERDTRYVLEQMRKSEEKLQYC